ncbi:mechanosensitive ion channel family protein [Sphingomonas sp.]|uniref:mechanosensitive ion channel family protein n=1 Tax=Sphingomonas sp. TaxID=28214 RepID=UPI0039C9CB91
MAIQRPTGAFDAARRQLNQLSSDTTQWLHEHFLQILIGVAAAALIVVVLQAVRSLGARLCRRDRSGNGWATIFGRALDRTGSIFILALAAKLVDGYAQPPELFKQTIDFIFVIASVIQVAIWVREIILGFIEHRTVAGEHEALGSAIGIIRLLVTIALFAIAAIVILDNLGVNVTGLVAGLGIGGIAIGLAAQGIFADLFAALSILFDRPFRRGDSIAYDQTGATVEAIGLKSTRLRAATGEQRIISNKNLLDKEIRNNTRLDYRRGKFALGVVYQFDPGRAAALITMLREIVEGEGQHFVRAGFVNFGASTLDFEVEFDVMSADYEVFYAARHAIGMAILKRFNEEKIDLAYPTQTTFTAAPDGRLIMPYPEVQKVAGVPGAEPIPLAPPES